MKTIKRYVVEYARDLMRIAETDRQREIINLITKYAALGRLGNLEAIGSLYAVYCMIQDYEK